MEDELEETQPGDAPGEEDEATTWRRQLTERLDGFQLQVSNLNESATRQAERLDQLPAQLLGQMEENNSSLLAKIDSLNPSKPSQDDPEKEKPNASEDEPPAPAPGEAEPTRAKPAPSDPPERARVKRRPI